MTTPGKIGAFTPAELHAELKALADRARTATKEDAIRLLPEAERLVLTIREELQRDREALMQTKAKAGQAQATIDAQFAQTDQAREAAQAQQMQVLEQQLEEARKHRADQGLWTRMTTADTAGKAAKAEIDATSAQHDAQDAIDAQARQAELARLYAQVQPFEGEYGSTYAVLEQALVLTTQLTNRAAGWGEGSEIFTRVQRMVDYARRANATDQDAKAFMAITAALTGRSIDEMNAIHTDLRRENNRLGYGHKLTDVEALATLACACGAAAISPGDVLGIWCAAVDHARRDGGFSSDEDARAMVVFCTAVTHLPVEQVQSDRRSINVDNFRGQDPEGAGLILLTHTLSGAPVQHLVGVYQAATRMGIPMEERGYMAMAAGLGQKSHDWVIGRFRGLVEHVVASVPLPYEERREAIREAAATLTIAAATSDWNDQQLVALFNMTAAFKPAFGAADYEARGGLVIGAVSRSCKV